MSFFSGAKRAAQFTFVSMPSSILGINQLKMGNQHIADLWRSLSYPPCPECNAGVLHRHAEATQNSEALYPWVCRNKDCDFTILAPADVNEVRKIALDWSAARTRQRLSFLDDPERYKLIRGHSIESRFWFVCASVLTAWLIYLIAAGTPLGACASALSFGFSACVLGVTKSYRAWQVETGNIFLPQSLFWHFFKNERWVR
ncbi:hypothetical protein [Janthinobacterium sp. CG_23.4]|uniref:hypothetical protein n=1 Tax=Janthinobacterium sp. CG_23.4 TaxID=2760707 RepID=UPI00247588BD|nr:hypothetical protein [Janthinobacterium sp. CG_23.4]MDH6160336.1 hypothetical protein [Janthinobacterium sp. CG_23.4]